MAMKERKRKIACFGSVLCLIAASPGAGCGEDLMPQGPFDDAQAVYRAPGDGAASIEGAWSPSAAAAAGDSHWLYADRATRQIVEASQDEKRVLWDLSPYELALGARPWGTDWGRGLTEIADDLYVLSASGRPLIALDRATGAVAVIGAASNAQTGADADFDGSIVGDVDFSRFRGIGRGDNRLYFVFDDGIFETPPIAPRDDRSASAELFRSLETAVLTRIAGKPGAEAQGNSGAAREIGLSFAEYAHIAEENGILYFWQTFDGGRVSARLCAFDARRGKIVVVTGHGAQLPPCSLDEFYPYQLPESPTLTVRNGSIYVPFWSDSSHFLKISADDIDWDGLRAEGTVDWFASPSEHMSGVVPFGDFDLAYDTENGSFWRLNGDDWTDGAVCLTGAKTGAERSESLQSLGNASPYAYGALMGPTSIFPWLGGSFALVWQPTAQLLNLLSMQTKEVSPIRSGEIDLLATDGRKTAWYKVGSAMNFLSIGNGGALSVSYAPQFFRAPSKTGAPCAADVFKLTSPPSIGVTGSALFMFVPNEIGGYLYRSKFSAVSALFEQGWHEIKPDSEDGANNRREFYNNGLNTAAITSHKVRGSLLFGIQQFNDRQYLVATNLFAAPIEWMGQTVEPDKSVVLSGQGSEAIADGAEMHRTKLNNIAAIDADIEKNTIWIVQDDGSLHELGKDGIWRRTANDCIAQAAAGGIAKLERQCADDACAWGVQTSAGARLCNDDGSDGSVLSENARDIASCGNKVWAYALDDAICIYHPQKFREPVCLPFAYNGEYYRISPSDAVSIGCGASDIYISARFIKKTGDAVDENADAHAWVMSGNVQNDGSVSVNGVLGNGVGLPDDATLGDVRFGTDVGRISFASDNSFYIWTRDACTVWRIPDTSDISEHTAAERIWTDARLCGAEDVAFGAGGNIYVAADGMISVYDAKTRAMRDRPPIEIPGAVLDMIEAGDYLMVLTEDGLYTVSDGVAHRRLSHPTYIFLNNEEIPVDYGYRIGDMPRMTRVPGAEAVWIPTFRDAVVLQVDALPRYFRSFP